MNIIRSRKEKLCGFAHFAPSRPLSSGERVREKIIARIIYHS